MNRQTPSIILLLVSFGITSCGYGMSAPGQVAGKIYVIVPATETSTFTTYLADMVCKNGMTPNLGQATDDRKHSIYVLDAKSPSGRLRSENVPLSGHEDAKLCGVYTELHSDPGQYLITVSPNTPMDNPRESLKLLAKISSGLKSGGYDVRLKPLLCSPRSKLHSED